MSKEIMTIGEEIDELIARIARIANISTEEAVDIMLSRARKFNHEA